MTAQQQAAAALLAFARSQITEDRRTFGSYDLGDSPHDAGYFVRVTLSVSYDGLSKQYAALLSVAEQRYRAGLASVRHEREMPLRRLGEYPATRYSAKTGERLYAETLAALRSNPQPLIDLLQEESERS